MQRYEQIACERCGGKLKLQPDGNYECEYCGAAFKEKAIDNYLHAICSGIHSVLDDVLDTQYQKEIGSIRQNLFAAVRKRDINGDEVVDYCRSLKKKIGDNDFYANFYEVATYGTVTEINSFLNSINVAEQPEYAICDVLDYLTNPVQAEAVPSVRWLIERAFKDNSQLKEKYDTKLDEDEGLIKAGVYDETLPRDVFLAYKSEDIAYVNELCEYLEGQGLKCFLSSRNLKHGRNAKNLYKKRLKKAIDHCTVLVFVSTHLSRTVGNARDLELTYIEEQDKQNAPAEYRHNYMTMPKQYKKPRVEYLKEDYVTGAANEDFARVFFKGYQYRTSKEAVYNAVDEYRRISPWAENKSEYKYCKNCGAINLLSAKYCSECGKGDFVATHDEYFAYMRSIMEDELAAQKLELEEEKQKLLEQEKQLREEIERQRSEINITTYKADNAEVESSVQQPLMTLEKYDKDTFEIDSSNRLVKYRGNKESTVIVPKGVISVAQEAFKDCKSLINIKLPDSVRYIGEGAFFGCKNLTSIIIPKGVKEIRNYTFSGCKNLTSVVIPDSVTVIDYSAFEDCIFLSNIIIPESVTYIGSAAFKGCASIEDIKIPKGVKTIFSSTFNSCTRLKSITIPDGVAKIESSAFQRCESLKNINIPQGITRIDDSLFYGCFSLTSVKIPDGVIEIGRRAFQACRGLKKIIIPDSLREIGASAFMNCSNLKKIVLPERLAFIGSSVFEGNFIKLTIYCRRKRDDMRVHWDDDWNCNCEVVWGYKGK